MSDLISRDFIKSLGGECIAARDSKTHELLPISSIDALPSAQPEREKSEWIEEDYVTKIKIRCKKCGEYARGVYRSKFCPNCGRYMWGKNNGKTT